MNLACVDLVKNIKNVVELYKKNIKKPTATITKIEIPKLIFEYKKEAFYLFESLLNKLKIDFVTILINLKIVHEKNNSDSKINKKEIKISNNPKCLLFQKKDKKISRNEKCEATGKKFKNCCGAL